MKKPEETIEILTKEIESLNSIEAHDLGDRRKFCVKVNKTTPFKQ